MGFLILQMTLVAERALLRTVNTAGGIHLVVVGICSQGFAATGCGEDRRFGEQGFVEIPAADIGEPGGVSAVAGEAHDLVAGDGAVGAGHVEIGSRTAGAFKRNEDIVGSGDGAVEVARGHVLVVEGRHGAHVGPGTGGVGMRGVVQHVSGGLCKTAVAVGAPLGHPAQVVGMTSQISTGPVGFGDRRASGEGRAPGGVLPAVISGVTENDIVTACTGSVLLRFGIPGSGSGDRVIVLTGGGAGIGGTAADFAMGIVAAVATELAGVERPGSVAGTGGELGILAKGKVIGDDVVTMGVAHAVVVAAVSAPGVIGLQPEEVSAVGKRVAGRGENVVAAGSLVAAQAGGAGIGTDGQILGGTVADRPGGRHDTPILGVVHGVAALAFGDAAVVKSQSGTAQTQ